jgi:mono/diheme cytochrome c family protein
MTNSNFPANFPVIAVVAFSSLGAAIASPVSYNLPPETAAFKPGPNLDLVKNNCTACHSADYIAIQPRGPKFKKGFLAGRSDQDDQGLRRADRRCRCRQDRGISHRDVLSIHAFVFVE